MHAVSNPNFCRFDMADSFVRLKYTDRRWLFTIFDKWRLCLGVYLAIPQLSSVKWSGWCVKHGGKRQAKCPFFTLSSARRNLFSNPDSGVVVCAGEFANLKGSTWKDRFRNELFGFELSVRSSVRGKIQIFFITAVTIVLLVLYRTFSLEVWCNGNLPIVTPPSNSLKSWEPESRLHSMEGY